MKIIKTLGIIVIIGFLSGCGGTTTVTQTKFEVPEISDPAPPPQLQLRDVEFRVYNKEKLKKIVEEADKRGQNIALFALTAEEYEDLSTNIQDIKGYISKQKEIIIFYRQTLKDIRESVNKQNNDGDQTSNSNNSNTDNGSNSDESFFSRINPF